MATEERELSYALSHLSTCTPSSSARAWQSAPHPHLPIIATACSDKTIRVYSLTSFTLLSTITGGHTRSVRCCAWKPTLPSKAGAAGAGESTLATGSFDATAAIWIGRPGGQQQQEIDFTSRNHSEDDDRSDDANEDFRFAVVLEGHDSEVKSIAWSLYGTFLATCSRDKTVWIWESLDSDSSAIGRGGHLAGSDDEDNYETVAVMSEHQGDVKCVAWHPSEEQCLASSSYDDLVRIWREDIEGEWGCVGVCEGHEGTVWCVAWEPVGDATKNATGDIVIKAADNDAEFGPQSGPRLVSCSDDFSVRVWRRKPKLKAALPEAPRLPSIIRNDTDEEEWYEECKLPISHDRAIYSVAWSKISKRIVSAGSDGKLVVYEEVQDLAANMINGGGEQSDNQDVDMSGVSDSEPTKASQWKIIAEIEAAHGVFEINHVCWASRSDRAKSSSDEEIIISTGDDGEVKIWTLDVV